MNRGRRWARVHKPIARAYRGPSLLSDSNMHAIVFDPNRSVLPTRFNLAWQGQTLAVPAVLEGVLQLFNGGSSAEQLGSALAAFPSAFLNLGISPKDLPGAILDTQHVLAERLGPNRYS